MKPAPRRLQRRLLAAMAGFTLAVAAVFSFYTLIFVYEVEDAVLRAELTQEAAYQQQQRSRSGSWAVPRNEHIRLYATADALPGFIRDLHAAEPRRVEFSGADGRHFHLQSMPGAAAEPAWLLYEVSDRLVVRPMRDRLLALLAWTALVAVALALLAGYMLARRLTGPLSLLADEVAQLDPVHLPPQLRALPGDDEVGVVARGLAGLVERLRDFTARERSFTRDASHELRTPLAVIRSAGDQLEQHAGLDVLARQHVRLIRESTASLEQIVDTLLALAREEHAQTPAVPVRLRALLERAVVDQSPRLDGKPVEVVLDVAESACLHAPPGVLGIVFANLVGNAFAHTAAGTVRITVEDNTLCIRNPASDCLLPQEPGPFRKGADSDGMGLGLAIAYRLCLRYALPLQVHAGDGEVIARLALATPPPADARV